MLILLDHNAPKRLALHLQGHSVSTAKERGWDRLTNGDLLASAEEAGFELFLTADKNLRYQQNLSERKISIIVLGHSPWRVVSLRLAEIAAAINAAVPGSYAEVDIPLPPKKPFIGS
jgi:putative NIF3 family GTP cyclohydrolase 1 type 2